MEINPAEHAGTSLGRLGVEPMAHMQLHVGEGVYQELRRRAFDSHTSVNRLVLTCARRHLNAGDTPVMRGDGGRNRRMHCRVPESLYERLRADAYEHGVSVNRLMCAWLADDYTDTVGGRA
ncbi:MAG: hypothetical protein U0N15_02850 [Bifidobacterium choerinum]